jgi:putative acetyltransferase
MYKLDIPQKNEYPVLLDVWESSVRATHHFLKKNDIEILKKIIQEKDVFSHVSLTCARDINDNILGIMGVSADNLEMLFIDSRFIGQGIGKLLLRHAITNLNITKVDVNEQNIQAIKFYEHFGFKVTSRSEHDEMGKPYPILHMQIPQDNK